MCEICKRSRMETLLTVCLLNECVELSTLYRKLLFSQFANSFNKF